MTAKPLLSVSLAVSLELPVTPELVVLSLTMGLIWSGAKL
jgi:hypothetical protein